MFLSNQKGHLPLISCLCVTHNRVSLLRRAIDCFEAQTYSNKEMVIVYEHDDKATRKFIASLNRKNIKSVEVSSFPKRTLGELRNISISEASGDYFCQWDADDWYHNRRLEIQMAYISTMCKPACMLTYWILFNSITKKAYLSPKRVWEGSILCKKSIAVDNTIEYASLAKSEDFYFVENLLKHNVVYPLDLPHLYIYVYHAENTWDYDHFQMNFKAGKELSKGTSTTIHKILRGRYSNREASRLLSSTSILSEMEYKYDH